MGPESSHQSPCKKRTQNSQRESHVPAEAGTRVTVHRPRTTGRPPKLEEARWTLLESLCREPILLTLDFGLLGSKLGERTFPLFMPTYFCGCGK